MVCIIDIHTYIPLWHVLHFLLSPHLNSKFSPLPYQVCVLLIIGCVPSSDTMSYPCPCKLEFMTALDLYNHEAESHLCPVEGCDKSYLNWDSRKRHINVHKNVDDSGVL